MGFKGLKPRVPLELGKLEGEEVVADELVNDALHKRFKMILTRDLLLSVLMQMERLLRNIANMFGSSYWGARMRIMYNFLNNFSYILYHVFSR